MAATALALVDRASEVRVTLQTRQLSFTTSGDEQSLFANVSLSHLRLTGYERLDLGVGELRSIARTILPPGSHVVTRAAGPGNGAGFRDVQFAGIRVPPRSIVTLFAPEDEPLHLKADIAAKAEGAFEAGPDLLFDCDACQVGNTSLPAELRFLARRRQRVVFTGADTGTTLIARLPKAEKLAERDIEIAGPVAFVVRNGKRLESAVIGKGGTIELPELNRTIKFEAGEFVEIADLSGFVIRSIELADGLQVKLHGVAGRLATGPMLGVKARLPSYLEWLWSRERLKVTFSAAALAATTLLAILKKTRVLVEE